MPRLYTVGGELWLEKTRIASETGQDVFRPDMIDEEIHEAVDTILKAVGITLEPMACLEADDVSDQSAPFRVVCPDGKEIEFVTHSLAYQYLVDYRESLPLDVLNPDYRATSDNGYEIINRWGNSVDQPSLEDCGVNHAQV